MAVTPMVADPEWDDLVDRLAVYDLAYLTGGSAWDGHPSPYHTSGDVPVLELVTDLAQSPHGRMRNALVALLFRHPELATSTLAAAGQLVGDERARLRIRSSVLAAAALHMRWRFVLDIYLPGQPGIAADDLAQELGAPSPREEYGRACLSALADVLREGQTFPFAYEREWHDAADHVLESLRAEARARPT